MVFDRLQPYNDLPPLPPDVDAQTPKVLIKAVTAGRALAELKGLGEIIPNQAILVNTLVLQEAKASSEIENVITTNDALFKAFTAAADPDPATKEVLRYREALWTGYDSLKKNPRLTTDLFIAVVKTLTKNEDGVRNRPGTEVINSQNKQVIYTPPYDDLIINKKLKNLEDFINSNNSIDPLIKLPLIHYQFEAIHPFFDGNGRTGRIINILFLVKTELLNLPVLYLSKAIIDKKSEYYRLIREVTEKNAWEPWILFMLDAIEGTATFTRARIVAIRDLMQETMEKARAELPPKVYSKELIELLFRQPYTKGQFLVDVGIAKRQTAAVYLKELEKIGILESQKVGKEVIYLNLKLYDLLSR